MGVGERGCPAFNTNSQCLGLMLQRKGQAGGGGSFNIMSFMPAVLPTEDIIDVMKQVPPPKEKEEQKK
jgi:hypothetical protein